MKWRPGKRQISIMLSVIMCAVVIMLIYYALFHGKNISKGINKFLDMLMPIITGCVIGYILSPVLNFIESKWIYPIYNLRGIDLKNPANIKRRKKVRKLSVTLTMGLFFLVLYAMLMILIPQLVKSISEIVRNFPIYVSNSQRMLDKYLNDNPTVRKLFDQLIQQYSATINGLFKDRVVPNISTLVTRVSKSMINVIQVFFYLLVGTIVAIYILNSKELFIGQAKKTAYAFLKENAANEVIGAFRYAHHTFTAFITGKLVDSLIVGLICFTATQCLKIPYPVVLAFAVGITNLIPFFGPYLGAGFGLILLIMINPVKALVFLIMIMVLQQIDGNILGPLILGNSTGLSSFWVIFAIMFFGGIWGPIGWIIGVPVFACIYTFFGHITMNKLRAKKLPRDTSIYIDAAYIENDDIVMISEANNNKYYVHNETSSWRKIFKVYKTSKKYLENVVPSVIPSENETEDESDIQSNSDDNNDDDIHD